MKALLLGADVISESMIDGSIDHENGLNGDGLAETDLDSFANADAILNATHSVLDVSTPAAPTYDYGSMNAIVLYLHADLLIMSGTLFCSARLTFAYVQRPMLQKLRGAQTRPHFST